MTKLRCTVYRGGVTGTLGSGVKHIEEMLQWLGSGVQYIEVVLLLLWVQVYSV